LSIFELLLKKFRSSNSKPLVSTLFEKDAPYSLNSVGITGRFIGTKISYIMVDKELIASASYPKDGENPLNDDQIIEFVGQGFPWIHEILHMFGIRNEDIIDNGITLLINILK